MPIMNIEKLHLPKSISDGYTTSPLPSIGLARHTAGFEAQRLPAPLNFFNVDIEHVDFPFALRRRLKTRSPPLWTASPVGVWRSGPIAGRALPGTRAAYR